MIDKQINNTEQDDLNTSFKAESPFSAREVIELTKQELLKFVNAQVGILEDCMLENDVKLEDMFFYKAGFMDVINKLREELEG